MQPALIVPGFQKNYERTGPSRRSHWPRSTGERKYYLSNLPADTPIKQLAGAIKARWVCEQAHQQLKEELGLDHFEGRSWKSLHRHALMSMIALAFLQSLRLKQAKGGEKNLGPAPETELISHRTSHH
jgi:SRSO17 transposase